MLRYSSYQSIHHISTDEVKENRRGSIAGSFSRGLILRLISLVIVTWLSGTGLLTAFSAPTNSDIPATKLVVESGDTLWKIASVHKPERMDIRIYIEGMIRLNELEGGEIQAGQILFLPDF